MAKHWGVTALVALALLLGTEGAPPQTPEGLQPPPGSDLRYPLIQQPRSISDPVYPQPPLIQRPRPGSDPRYPQLPLVQPPRPGIDIQYPQLPLVQLPRPGSDIQYPQLPLVQLPRPGIDIQYPQLPLVQPPRPGIDIQYPQLPLVQPPRPGIDIQYPQLPLIQPPKPGKHILPPLILPQPPTFPKVKVPGQPDVQRCDVALNVRIPCGGPDISAVGCETISCCFDGQQCYFGKAVTVQCTKDAQFIVVVARDTTLPNIDLETISLLDTSCTHVDSNSEFAIYQFPVTACGSIVIEEPGCILYENRMSSSYEVGIGPRGVITRDSHYELLFQCRYGSTSVETVVLDVMSFGDVQPIAALGPIRVHLRLANGQCTSKGCNEVDMAYSSYYTDADYPVSKVLRDPVYVEVQLLEKTDPNLVLTLGRCWTTTYPDPHSLPQWDILTDGCPYRDDRYLSSLVPVGASSGLNFPGHYKRFLFKMFTFVDPGSMEPLRQQVFIHCSTAVCIPAAGQSCEPSCYRKKRDVSTSDQRKVVASVGPVIMRHEQ